MARPVKKPPDQWKQEILNEAKELFLSKGYEETSVDDIMKLAGGAKGMFYRFFKTKEEIMQALGDEMFFQNNPFEEVRRRTDLTGLEKIRQVFAADSSDKEREAINTQAVSILKDPRILASAVEANRRVLTPLWLELIEEGMRDGSIHTEYPKELAELLPLVNFWLMPSVFPANTHEILHKCRFIAQVLSTMGLPIIDQEMYERIEAILGTYTEEPGDLQEHVTKNPPEHVTENPPEHMTENLSEHVTKNPPEHVTKNPPEHMTENPPEHVTEPHRTWHRDSRNALQTIPRNTPKGPPKTTPPLTGEINI